MDESGQQVKTSERGNTREVVRNNTKLQLQGIILRHRGKKHAKKSVKYKKGWSRMKCIASKAVPAIRQGH